jgi:hypothetical protein
MRNQLTANRDLPNGLQCRAGHVTSTSIDAVLRSRRRIAVTRENLKAGKSWARS